jgi:two-component system, OmpR family, sensor kinase
LSRIRFPRISLRARLALAFATGMAIVLTGVAVFVYVQLHGDLVHAVDAGLQSRAQVIIGNAHRVDPSLGGRARRLIDPDEAFAQVLTPSGGIVEATAAVASQPLLDRRVLATVRAPTFFDRTPRRLDPTRLLVVPAAVQGARSFVIVGGTLSDTNEALGRVQRLFEIAVPFALTICSLIGWILAGAALRPVERMRREAEAISAADIARRLPVPTSDSTLARLATTLNRTFDRLQAALERERRFVDDASHELRTPLTVLKAEIDSALARSGSRAELQSGLESAAEEVDHLTRIAEDMLILARAQHGAIAIHRTETPLRAMLEQERRAFARQAATADVELAVDATDEVVWIDRTRIRQALDNLLDNAIRHAPSGSRVRLTGRTAADSLTITVNDDGPGFAPELLDRACEPFTRGPNTTYEGSGLGLAIVQVIAHAHGGRLHLRNRDHGGAHAALEVAAARLGGGRPA